MLWQVVAKDVASEQVNVSPPSGAGNGAGVAEQFQASAPPSPTDAPSGAAGVAETIHPPKLGALVGWRVCTSNKPRTDHVPTISQPLTLSVKAPPSPQEPD